MRTRLYRAAASRARSIFASRTLATASCLTSIGGDEARHRVVGQVHSISALVDEDRYRCVRCCVGNGLGHLFHDDRITDDEAKELRPLSGFLAQDFAGVKADELHQIRGSDRPFNKRFQVGNGRGRGERWWNAFMSGRPMVAVSLTTISSNGLDETTLNLRSATSIVGIDPAPPSIAGQA